MTDAANDGTGERRTIYRRRLLIQQFLALDATDDVEGNINLVLARLNQVGIEFSPLLGEASVRMIFSRSLDLNRAAFPWLADRPPNPHGEHFDVLRARFAGRSAAEIAGSSVALLATFCDILDALIGDRLTNSFLSAAFRPAGSAPTP